MPSERSPKSTYVRRTVATKNIECKIADQSFNAYYLQAKIRRTRRNFTNRDPKQPVKRQITYSTREIISHADKKIVYKNRIATTLRRELKFRSAINRTWFFSVNSKFVPTGHTNEGKRLHLDVTQNPEDVSTLFRFLAVNEKIFPIRSMVGTCEYLASNESPGEKLKERKSKWKRPLLLAGWRYSWVERNRMTLPSVLWKRVHKCIRQRKEPFSLLATGGWTGLKDSRNTCTNPNLWWIYNSNDKTMLEKRNEGRHSYRFLYLRSSRVQFLKTWFCKPITEPHQCLATLLKTISKWKHAMNKRSIFVIIFPYILTLHIAFYLAPV